MKLWQLEEILQQVQPFKKPNIKLEQYITSPHIASHVLFTAFNSYDDIEDKNVLDLGCGTGMLSIGSSVLGASLVTGIDIDPNALEICKQNIEDIEVEDVELINMDILHFQQIMNKRRKRIEEPLFDTVVTNPPFGTRTKGLDLTFLKIGTEMANVVYSLHKTSTRDYVVKIAKKWNCKVDVLAELRYDLPKSYKFHKKESKDIYVDLIRVEKI